MIKHVLEIHEEQLTPELQNNCFDYFPKIHEAKIKLLRPEHVGRFGMWLKFSGRVSTKYSSAKPPCSKRTFCSSPQVLLKEKKERKEKNHPQPLMRNNPKRDTQFLPCFTFPLYIIYSFAMHLQLWKLASEAERNSSTCPRLKVCCSGTQKWRSGRAGIWTSQHKNLNHRSCFSPPAKVHPDSRN